MHALLWTRNRWYTYSDPVTQSTRMRCAPGRYLLRLGIDLRFFMYATGQVQMGQSGEMYELALRTEQ